MRQRIVFVGGGYATLHAYAVLARRRRREIREGRLEIVVVSADDHHSFHGFTGEVLAGDLPYAVTRTRLVDALPRATVVLGTVTHVDRAHRAVTVARPCGAVETLGYDELVVAAGGREPLSAVPGMAEHAYTLRAPGEIRRLLTRLVALEHPASTQGPRDIVVVGGGLAGVEMAAAIAGRPTSVTARRVHLVHAGDTLLPDLAAAQPVLVRRAAAELRRLGVEVTLGVRVTSVSRRHVTLSDGRVLPAALVLGTTGQRPVRLPGLEDLPTDPGGRLLTTPDLAVAPGVWAAGDAARVNHPRTRTAVPANALWAIKAGDHLGRNLARTVVGAPTLPLRYLGLGQAAAFGPGRGVAELYGVPLTGRTAWLMRLAFFIRFMPSRANAVETLGRLVGGRPVAPTAPVPAPQRHAAVTTHGRPAARVA